jgi:hypothetical protein
MNQSEAVKTYRTTGSAVCLWHFKLGFGGRDIKTDLDKVAISRWE